MYKVFIKHFRLATFLFLAVAWGCLGLGKALAENAQNGFFGQINLQPNPIMNCINGAGSGTLSWTSSIENVEIRKQGRNGAVVAQGGNSGSVEVTGVRDGDYFVVASQIPVVRHRVVLASLTAGVNCNQTLPPNGNINPPVPPIVNPPLPVPPTLPPESDSGSATPLQSAISICGNQQVNIRVTTPVPSEVRVFNFIRRVDEGGNINYTVGQKVLDVTSSLQSQYEGVLTVSVQQVGINRSEVQFKVYRKDNNQVLLNGNSIIVRRDDQCLSTPPPSLVPPPASIPPTQNPPPLPPTQPPIFPPPAPTPVPPPAPAPAPPVQATLLANPQTISVCYGEYGTTTISASSTTPARVEMNGAFMFFVPGNGNTYTGTVGPVWVNGDRVINLVRADNFILLKDLRVIAIRSSSAECL